MEEEKRLERRRGRVSGDEKRGEKKKGEHLGLPTQCDQEEGRAQGG